MRYIFSSLIIILYTELSLPYLPKQTMFLAMPQKFHFPLIQGSLPTQYIGDYGANRTMKYRESTKGKLTRGLFCRRGHTVSLVDEHKTSKMCAACGSECTKPASILATPNPHPWRRAVVAAAGGGASGVLLVCFWW